MVLGYEFKGSSMWMCLCSAEWCDWAKHNKHFIPSLDIRINVKSSRVTSSPKWQDKTCPWIVMRTFSRAKEAVIAPFLLRADCTLIIYVQNISCLLQQLVLLCKKLKIFTSLFANLSVFFYPHDSTSCSLRKHCWYLLRVTNMGKKKRIIKELKITKVPMPEKST